MTPEVARKYVVPTRELVAQLAGLFSSKAKEAGWHMTAALAYDIQREAEIPNAESMVEEVQDGPVDSSSADGVRCDSPTPCQTTDEAPVSGRPSDTQLGAEVGAVPASPAPTPPDSTQEFKTPNYTQGFTPAPEETRWILTNIDGSETLYREAPASWVGAVAYVPRADLDAMREGRDSWEAAYHDVRQQRDALRAQLAAATAPVDREKVKELATLIRDSKTWNPEGWVRAAITALGREVKEGA